MWVSRASPEHYLPTMDESVRPERVKVSVDGVDSRPVAWCPGERRVARDEWRIERLGQCHVHCIIRSDVVPQCPRASQKVEMPVPVKIQVSKIRKRFSCPVR